MILKNKKKRHNYMIKRLRMFIAYQVRLLRFQRELSKAELADKCKLPIKIIDKIENWDAEFPTIKALRAIAEGLDCALMIRFEGWEDVIESIVPDYQNDKKAN